MSDQAVKCGQCGGDGVCKMCSGVARMKVEDPCGSCGGTGTRWVNHSCHQNGMPCYCNSKAAWDALPDAEVRTCPKCGLERSWSDSAVREQVRKNCEPCEGKGIRGRLQSCPRCRATGNCFGCKGGGWIFPPRGAR